MISYKVIVSKWDNFFFEPKPTEGIAIFRIIWCSILFMYYLLDLQNAADFYGPHAIISQATVKGQFPFPHINIFNMLGVSYETVYGLLAIYGLALMTSILGYHTRFSLIVVTICMVSLHQRNIWLLSSSEILMRLVTILLVFSPCGHSLSIDSLLGKINEGFKRPKEWAPWALRLIQIQISVVYVWTVWQKLKGDTWFDGSALYYATRLDSMKNFPVPYLFDSITFLKVSTWGTLLLEVALGTLIWIKEFRRPLIAAGVLFHIGIEYSMSIPFFEIFMMALLLNFYTPEEYRNLVVRLRDSTLTESMKKKILWITRDTEKTA